MVDTSNGAPAIRSDGVRISDPSVRISDIRTERFNGNAEIEWARGVLCVVAMQTTKQSKQANQESILRDLERAIFRLAEAVEGEPPIALALRRFAGTLPQVSPGATRSGGLRGVLYSALDEGALDARGFDLLMLAEGRTEKQKRRRRAQRPMAGEPSRTS